MTTPDAPAIHRALRRMLDARVATAVIEVTSHGIALGRVAGLPHRARRHHQPGPRRAPRLSPDSRPLPPDQGSFPRHAECRGARRHQPGRRQGPHDGGRVGSARRATGGRGHLRRRSRRCGGRRADSEATRLARPSRWRSAHHCRAWTAAWWRPASFPWCFPCSECIKWRTPRSPPQPRSSRERPRSEPRRPSPRWRRSAGGWRSYGMPDRSSSTTPWAIPGRWRRCSTASVPSGTAGSESSSGSADLAAETSTGASRSRSPIWCGRERPAAP